MAKETHKIDIVQLCWQHKLIGRQPVNCNGILEVLGVLTICTTAPGGLSEAVVATGRTKHIFRELSVG